MKRTWRWWLLPCYVLTLPLVAVALLYAIVIARARSWRWIDGCLTFVAGTKDNGETSRMWGNPGGQCWSWVVGFASEGQRNRRDLRIHEYVHVWQAMICSLIGMVSLPWLGLYSPLAGCGLFALAYAWGFMWHWATRGFGPWRDAYERNPFERHAYERQGQYLHDVERRAQTARYWGEM